MCETFYIIHLFLFILILITAGMQCSDITLKTLIIALLAASIWPSNRLARTTWHAFGNDPPSHLSLEAASASSFAIRC
jgi:hypothetical protein